MVYDFLLTHSHPSRGILSPLHALVSAAVRRLAAEARATSPQRRRRRRWPAFLTPLVDRCLDGGGSDSEDDYEDDEDDEEVGGCAVRRVQAA